MISATFADFSFFNAQTDSFLSWFPFIASIIAFLPSKTQMQTVMRSQTLLFVGDIVLNEENFIAAAEQTKP